MLVATDTSVVFCTPSSLLSRVSLRPQRPSKPLWPYSATGRSAIGLKTTKTNLRIRVIRRFGSKLSRTLCLEQIDNSATETSTLSLFPMGNSTSSSNQEEEWDQFDGIETLGYRVLGVQPDSPASQAGLVSFFDFLLGANETMLLGSGEGLQEGEEYDDVDFPAMLQEHLNKPLELLVWNIKHQEKRLVTIVPSNDWGGAGLLGVTIRLDNYGGADERLIRVLSVERQSPAAIAGLVPLQDYLLGTTTDSFSDTSVLASVLYQHVDQVIELYVYNTESDVVRVVSLLPTWSWGGNGLLGAEVGTGYLHRLPQASRSSTGTSVERKVRLVGNHGSEKNDTEDQSLAPTPRGQQAPVERRQVVLEVEPQLEMEVEDEARPEDTNKTIHQVANHTSEDGISERKQRHVSEQIPKRETDSAMLVKSVPVAPVLGKDAHTAPSVDAEESFKDTVSAPPFSQAQQPMVSAPLPVRTGVSTYSPSPVPNAAALFAAGPPPGGNVTASAASSFLPPPPLSILSEENKEKAIQDEVDLR